MSGTGLVKGRGGASVAIGVLSAGVAFFAINNTSVLEEQPLLKVVVAALIGVVTGYPLIGLPSLRDGVRNWLRLRFMTELRRFGQQLAVELPDEVAFGDVDKFEWQLGLFFTDKEEQIRSVARRERLL